jgi:ubiquinone/menaquinone biosynthesis C-methylase UbiE
MTEDDLAALTPETFRRDHVPEDAARDLAAQLFVLDLQEQLPGVQRLRDWTLAALAPREGETTVDVGCGTGAEVRRLAGLVGPTGRAVGVEPHAGLRAEAEARAAAAGSPAVFVDGDVAALPFEAGSVDVVRCERVFQHLADPVGAAREIARVLAPGGRVALVDSDWASFVQTPGDPELLGRVMEASWRRWANPFSGRTLRRVLRRAGLVVDEDIGADAVVMPESQLRDATMLRLEVGRAVQEGVVTQAEADRLVQESVEGAERGEAFAAVTMFSVVGRRVDGAG